MQAGCSDVNSSPDKEGTCGMWRFRSPCLQGCANVKLFTFLFCTVFLIDAISDAYIIGCITTIEQRFQFSSKYSGLLLSSCTFSQLVSVLIGSYLGRSRQPSFLALGIFIAALGKVIMATPHFIYGAGSSKNVVRMMSNDALCLDQEDDNTAECSNANQVAYSVLVVGMILSGMGSSCLFSLGTSYVDDNLTNPRSAPMYLSKSTSK